MPIIPAAIALGTIAAAGAGVANIVSSQAAAKKAAAGQVSATPNASQTVGDKSASNNANLGRAALISTSPSGVIGTDPTGRRKLLGND